MRDWQAHRFRLLQWQMVTSEFDVQPSRMSFFAWHQAGAFVVKALLGDAVTDVLKESRTAALWLLNERCFENALLGHWSKEFFWTEGKIKACLSCVKWVQISMQSFKSHVCNALVTILALTMFSAMQHMSDCYVAKHWHRIIYWNLSKFFCNATNW